MTISLAVPNGAAHRLTGLDSLRGLAALWVVVFHFTFGVAYAWFPGNPARAREVAPFVANIEGMFAVYLFFMISGFVIVMTLDRCRAVSDFAVSRFARIYPSYWCCLALTVAAAVLVPVAVQPVGLARVAANATMLQDLLGVAGMEAAYWSLIHELVFYVQIAILFRLGLMARIELFVLLQLMAFAVIYRAWPGIGASIPWRIQLLSGLMYAPFFATGMIAYRIHTLGFTVARGTLILAALGLWIVGQSPKAQLLVLGLALLMLAGVRGWPAPVMRHRLLVWLGGISYPLYLVHQTVGFRIQLIATDSGLTPWAGFALALAGVVGLAALVSRFVERPAQRAIRRWWARRAPAAGLPHASSP